MSPPRQFDTSPITAAILATGDAWEAAVLTQYLPDAVTGEPSADDPQDVTKRILGVDATLSALRSADDDTAIFQPTLRAPATFYASYGLDPAVVEIADCRPDLLTFVDTDYGLEVRVIDLKASDAMKLSHRIQVGVYTLLLEHVLAAEGIELRTSRQGGVWLYDQDEPEWFPLASIVPQVETLLSTDVMPILTQPVDEVFWHLYHRCEWCDFREHCQQEAEDTNDVSRVPYLTHFAKRHLAEAGQVRTVDDLANFLERDDADDLLRGSATLEGRRGPLSKAVDALRSGQVRLTGSASVAMPKGENVRLVLSLQENPVTGAMYGYAINRVGGRDVFGSGTDTLSAVAQTGSDDDLRVLRHRLVRDLIGILRSVHDHNAATDEWRSQLSVQAYVFDSYEREILVAELLAVIESDRDREVVEQALALLFHFQHPDLLKAEDQPASEVMFPLVVVTAVLRQVMALPIPVVLRFADVNAALQPSEYGFTYRPLETYDFALSNRLRADALLRAWSADDPDDRTDRLARIEGVLKARAWGANSVINGLRERLDGTSVLFAWPPKFLLPGSLGIRDPLLGRLAFISMYEALLAYLQLRHVRTTTEDERIASGATWLLTATVQDAVYVLDERQHDLGMEPNTFPNRILTVDDDDGRRARLAFDDCRCRKQVWPPKHLPVALATVRSVTTDGTVRVELNSSQAFQPPAPGQRVRIEERFTDWNTGRVTAELSDLDAEGGSRFVRMINDPAAARTDLSLPAAVRSDVVALAQQHGMTGSQLAALAGVLDHDLQLVWGPPGTGKTHFLALAMLCMLEGARRHDLRLRVAVTAFTHAAINNCLRKVRQLQDELGVFGGRLPVLKLTKNEQPPPGVDALPVSQASGELRETARCVVGGTVWRMRDLDVAEFAFDMVVIDEASQVKVAEASIPVRRLRDGGRVLIAGDDKQLPPIVNGGYPEIDGQPLLHRSILECLRDRDEHSMLTVALVENWRMNDRLCAYPASSIYPAEYAPATPEVAARRLPPTRTEDELYRLLLDPKRPVVASIFEEVKATAENPEEAALVADLAVVMREDFEGTDEQFWSQRLFVVSPHHVQIRAIRRELAARRDWDVAPFVDTVDKMQGQECDAVIVSYGVSDVEYALNESEFIYSLNRLNVAVTRARMKSIVLLSRRLLEPPIQALESDHVADGIAYMQGYVQWLQRHGHTFQAERHGSPLTIVAG